MLVAEAFGCVCVRICRLSRLRSANGTNVAEVRFGTNETSVEGGEEQNVRITDNVVMFQCMRTE